MVDKLRQIFKKAYIACLSMFKSNIVYANTVKFVLYSSSNTWTILFFVKEVPVTWVARPNHWSNLAINYHGNPGYNASRDNPGYHCNPGYGVVCHIHQTELKIVTLYNILTLLVSIWLLVIPNITCSAFNNISLSKKFSIWVCKSCHTGFTCLHS